MGISILLAEQRALFRKGLRAAIETDSSLEVVGEAEDGRSAVSLALQLSPDVAVLSLGLPQLNGIESTRQIRENRSTRVLLLGSIGSRHLLPRALQAGAAGFILCTCSDAALTAACRTVAQGQIYIGEEVSGPDALATAGAPRANMHRAYAVLTPREREVVQLLAEGMSTKEIASELQLSARTVESHRYQIMSKLSLRGVADLTKFALREGLTTL